jgi:hypothetical protein
VARSLDGLDECRTRVQLLVDQIDAQRSETMTRSSLNLTIVATVFLPLTFITGLLGMNVAGILDQHNPFGFWLVTGLSLIVSLLAWVVLRLRMQDQYQGPASTGKEKPGRLPEALSTASGSASVLEEGSRAPGNQYDALPASEERRQDSPGGINVARHHSVSARRVVGVHAIAVLLALALFYFHLVVIFDVLGEMFSTKAWLLEHVGPNDTGNVFLLGCFLTLTLAHVVEAAGWGLFLRGARGFPSLTEGIYFTAASLTTLGYGDVLLKYPWRHLGTLIAITGVLMFGCSTAFLFVVLQRVWVNHL